MIYLSSFKLSDRNVKNPNIYPYNVFHRKDMDPFVFAPMVHWPEVMVTYDSTDKVLFSADGFGKFGALDVEEDWDCEARRYYIGTVGKSD